MDNPNTLRTDNEARNIGWAVKQLHNASNVIRRGWNGKNQYIFLVSPCNVGSKNDMTLPFVAIQTQQGETIPWLCSQANLLATDWEIL